MTYNLCCISEELKAEGVGFQTMTYKTFCQIFGICGEKAALLTLSDRWLNNVKVTVKTIEHCARHGWGYRVSSSLFPLLTHPDFKYGLEDVPQAKSILDAFEDVLANNAWSVRLSTHPDQFNVLASENSRSVERTIRELNHQGWVMDKLGCQRNFWNPINIHINCSKGNPKDIADRFVSNLERCDESVRSRLVVENEDKGIWNVENLLEYVYKPYQIPITFDTLHHKCNPSPNLVNDLGEHNALTACDITWDVRPLFHYSESHPGKPNPRSHADFPTDVPPECGADWDIELKKKDKAIRALYLIELTREGEIWGFYNESC